MTTTREQVVVRKQQAIGLYSSGHLMAAAQICEELCRQSVADHDIYCLLGIISGRLGQYESSVNYCMEAIRIHPKHVDAYYNLGLALSKLGRHAEAIRALETVTNHRPSDAKVHYILGILKTTMGDYTGAIQGFHSALRITPGFMDAIAGEAQVYEKQGDLGRAFETVRPYISSLDCNPKIAILYGKIMLRRGEYDMPVALLEQLVEVPGLQAEDASAIHFVLGDLHDKVGRYDTAFYHYQAANRLKGVQFDESRFQAQVRGMLGKFSHNRMAHFPRSGCDSRLPLFIVGSPRSGTSLVEQILDSHPDVYGAGELPDITRIVESFEYLQSESGGQELAAIITPALLDEMSTRYLERLQSLSPHASRITDKMPGNFFNLGYVALMFPNARVIHVSRDPLDTCLSCYFQDFTGVHTYAYDLKNIGTFYLSYMEMMRHWRELLPLPIHELVYEDLVGDPEREIRRLLNFCGLEWDDACLNYHRSGRTIRTASYDQASRPIYKGSVARWRNYEKHIGPLIDMLDLG